jgi:chromosome segregation ATPase
MIAKSIPPTLALLVAMTLTAANAQTIDKERLRIDNYQQKVSSLQQSNSDIEGRLTQLDKQIKAMANSYEPEEKARDKAEARYQKALQAAMDIPSTVNRERAEAARFEYLMADRKYRRSSQDVSKLRKQQKALQAQLASNQEMIGKTGSQLKQQQELIHGMEKQAHKQATEQAKNERRLRLKKDAALRASRDELTKTRKQYAAAAAEIALLKSQLAEKEARASVAAAASSIAVATPLPTLSNRAAPLTGSTNSRIDKRNSSTDNIQSAMKSLQGDKAQYIALLEAAGLKQGARSRINKILHVRTFKNSRLSKQTSHSLKYLGNGVYQGKTVVRSGETAFVIGNKKWQWTIPKTDNKKQYIFTLDSRDKANPKLKVFARSEVQ